MQLLDILIHRGLFALGILGVCFQFKELHYFSLRVAFVCLLGNWTLVNISERRTRALSGIN